MNTKLPSKHRMLRARQVAEKIGMAESSVWRLPPLGLLPMPVRLSPGCTAWFEHEIDQWLEAKGASREAVARPVKASERGGSL